MVGSTSTVLDRIYEHSYSGESTIFFRKQKRDNLSGDFRELLFVLQSIEGTYAQQLKERTLKIVAAVEEWNPILPMSGKLSTEIMKILIDLQSIRLEKTGRRVSVKRRKSVWTKANEVAHRSLRSLIRLLFWPLIGS